MHGAVIIPKGQTAQKVAFLLSFATHLLSTYDVPGTVAGPWDRRLD